MNNHLAGQVKYFVFCIGLFVQLVSTRSVDATVVFGIHGAAATDASTIVTSQGHSAIVLNTLSSANLAGIDVLWALNSSNSFHLSELTANSASITSFVSGGGVFMYHDRFVSNANTILPSGGLINFTRDASASALTTNIDVLNSTSLVVNGPGGSITNLSLDGGSQSTHGFASVGSLPTGTDAIFSRALASEIVDFRYPSGLGDVYYSSIPLDFYLSATRSNLNFANIYAPNVVAHAAQLASTNDGLTVPEPSSFAIFSICVGLALGIRTRKVYQR